MSQDLVLSSERAFARDAERYLGRSQALTEQVGVLAQSIGKACGSGARLDEVAANERRIAGLEAEIAQKLEILATEKRAGERFAQLEKRVSELAKNSQRQRKYNSELERRIRDVEAQTEAAERECAQAKDATRAALAEAREFQGE